MCTNSFYPKITLPTRFANKSCSLIDQIYCKSTLSISAISSKIVISQLSDHFPCIVSIKLLHEKKHKPKYVSIHACTRSIINNFKDELKSEIPKLILVNNLMTDPNLSYQAFEDFVLRIKEKNMPMKTVRFDKYKHKMTKWVTTGIITSIKFRDKLYRQLKSHPVNSQEYYTLKTNLKTYNTILTKNIRKAKKDYYYDQFAKYKNDIRKTWDTLKDVIIRSKNTSSFPSHFIINTSTVTEKPIIADKFNEYFCEIGPKLAESIPSPRNPHVNFQSNLGTPCLDNFIFDYPTAEEIIKHIQNLKPKSSSGYDQISSKLLKEIGPIISQHLCLIINQSLCTGIFPDRLKLAKVIPLFKKGYKLLFENYRPISLLTAISKIFERVVFNQLYDHLTKHNLLFVGQYGFRKRHSTEYAALELVDRISNGLDNRKLPISIFLDLSKAFDTLDHQILLHKLYHYGIRNSALNWFSSYLTNRLQYIDIDGTKSNSRPLSTGVPQGFILGPLLFIIYMNDINAVSPKFTFILYADDTTMISSMYTFTSVTRQDTACIADNINEELSKISDWLAVNKLSLNTSKTKFIQFHHRQKTLNENDYLKLRINDSEIERVQEFNFLGLTINEYLDWSSHCNKIAFKISRTLGIMNRLKHELPSIILKLMYDALIVSLSVLYNIVGVFLLSSVQTSETCHKNCYSKQI